MKYKVNDIARVLGVTTNTIRRYEKAGYLSPRRDDSGYRQYNSYDISKTAMIRLLIKVGFTHEEIKSMLNNETDSIKEIAIKKLYDINEEMKKLYFLNHWLKDNITLFDTLENIGDGFITMRCRTLKYVLYSKGDVLLTEKDRLETINNFMYNTPEVQLIRIFKSEDFKCNNNIPYNGWAIKEYDIERLGVQDLVHNNEYIETYSSKDCVFGSLLIPVDHINDTEYLKEAHNNFLKKVQNYMNSNNMKISGDIIEVIVNLIGNSYRSLICIPYTQ